MSERGNLTGGIFAAEYPHWPPALVSVDPVQDESALLQQLLSPEEQAMLELDALLGAIEDNQNMSTQSYEEKIAKDNALFAKVMQVATSAAGMRNMEILAGMNERMRLMACNHGGFSEFLKENTLLTGPETKPSFASENGGHAGHAHDDEEADDEDDDKVHYHNRQRCRAKHKK